MKIHDKIDQGTSEWHSLRAGRLTASNAQAIGNAGKGLETEVYNTMARFFSSAEPENYTNADMERGNELEPTAISMYEMETGNKATIIGFVEMDNGFAGCSPDRFVNDDGLAEVKCPNDVNFLKLLVNKEKAIDTKYIWQMQMQMLICEKKWCDFIAYNPNFTQNLFIHRFEADPEMQEKLKIGIEKGGKLIESIKNIIN